MGRSERLYLQDMLDAIDALARFLAGRTAAAFAADEVLQSATLQKLEVLGEAARHVSSELRFRHPEVPWAEITGQRDIAVHGYFEIDWEIIWRTATSDVPSLRSPIEAVLRSLEESR